MLHDFSRPSYTYMDLFRNQNMRRITFLGIALWMLISLVFDTSVRNISNLNFDFYISFMVAASLELPADLLSIVGLNWLGRRWSSCFPMLACGLTMLACAWLTGLSLSMFCIQLISQFLDQSQAVMFMLGRFFATYSMNLGFQFTVEVG